MDNEEQRDRAEEEENRRLLTVCDSCGRSDCAAPHHCTDAAAEVWLNTEQTITDMVAQTLQVAFGGLAGDTYQAMAQAITDRFRCDEEPTPGTHWWRG